MKSLPSCHVLRVVDMHAAGEPVRIVESGYPSLTGATLLDKRLQRASNSIICAAG